MVTKQPAVAPVPKSLTRLSMKQVCERYGLTRFTITKAVAKGTFAKPLKVGGSIRFRIEDLQAFENRQLGEAA
jgi:predicted DNA-binding transcriptional regulator AlpA